MKPKAILAAFVAVLGAAALAACASKSDTATYTAPNTQGYGTYTPSK